MEMQCIAVRAGVFVMHFATLPVLANRPRTRLSISFQKIEIIAREKMHLHATQRGGASAASTACLP